MSAFAQHGQQGRAQIGLARRGIEQFWQEVGGQAAAMMVQLAQPLGFQSGWMQAAQQQGQYGLRARWAGAQRLGRGRLRGGRRGPVGRHEAAALPQVEGAERQPEHGFRRCGVRGQQRREGPGEAGGRTAGAGRADLQ